ncbi:MAG: nucleoside hydrolase [Bryobacterales bacterium]|nr:nucleoside hydrolase [Bryobacterales bacterium]
MIQEMRLFAVIVFAAVMALAQPVPLIFDTDMGNDIDDALALAVIHALESRGEAKLLAVTVTKDNPYAPVYCDLVNTFYKRGSIPVGMVKNGVTPKDANMIKVPVERKDASGAYVYPRGLKSAKDAPDAVELLRKVLSAQADGSVVIVQVGFSTNLARLLEKDRELVAKKVRLLSTMAGQFPTGKPEYNVKTDLAAAKKLFSEWPTPIVASGYEIGEAIKYPAVSIEKDFRYVKWHPVTDAYRNYMKMPYDRQTWDLTAVLYAVRPDRGYFGVSQPGTIKVGDKGTTTLEASAGGRHRYLTVNEMQKVKTLEALVELASQPPAVQ